MNNKSPRAGQGFPCGEWCRMQASVIRLCYFQGEWLIRQVRDLKMYET